MPPERRMTWRTMIPNFSTGFWAGDTGLKLFYVERCSRLNEFSPEIVLQSAREGVGSSKLDRSSPLPIRIDIAAAARQSPPAKTKATR